MEYPFKELNCSRCGKRFIPAVEHSYKELRKGKMYWFCSYTCNCAFNRENPIMKGSRWNKGEG